MITPPAATTPVSVITAQRGVGVTGTHTGTVTLQQEMTVAMGTVVVVVVVTTIHRATHMLHGEVVMATHLCPHESTANQSAVGVEIVLKVTETSKGAPATCGSHEK